MATTDKPIWNMGLINNGKLEQVYEMATVRHGHWVEAKYPLFTCSECGATYQDTGYGYNYCPNCGAKMDEVEKDADK